MRVSRFVSNFATAVAGGALVACAFAFGIDVVVWLALGVGCLVLVTVLCAFAVSGRGGAQRALDVLIATSAAWTVVASRVFGPGVEKWLSFAGGALLCVLGLAGLMLHEALIERELRRVADPARTGRMPEDFELHRRRAEIAEAPR